MSNKVLLADDSLTIQKVIKITLANEPFELFDCSDESTLFDQVSSVKPDIVFLDFSLSESKTGYELAKLIRSESPKTKVLMMFGTFDTIEDHELEGAGVDAHIVKPFDSTKFINICRTMINESAHGSDSFDDAAFDPSHDMTEDKTGELSSELLSELNDEIDEDDQWEVNHEIDELPIPDKIEDDLQVNALEQELEGWGVEVPGVIDGESQTDHEELPPIIDDGPAPIVDELPSVISDDDKQLPVMEEELPSIIEEDVDDLSLPNDDDLAYPDMDSLDDLVASVSVEEVTAPTSKLVSASDLAPTLEVEVEDEDTSVEDSEHVKNLEMLIEDESDDDLWSADEVEDTDSIKQTNVEEIEQSDEDISVLPPKKNEREEDDKSLVTDDLDALFPNEKIPSYASLKEVKNLPVDLDLDKIKADIMNELKNSISEIVRSVIQEELDKKFSKEIDKVAWEVIPDLAENIIKQEIASVKKKLNQ